MLDLPVRRELVYRSLLFYVIPDVIKSTEIPEKYAGQSAIRGGLPIITDVLIVNSAYKATDIIAL